MVLHHLLEQVAEGFHYAICGLLKQIGRFGDWCTSIVNYAITQSLHVPNNLNDRIQETVELARLIFEQKLDVITKVAKRQPIILTSLHLRLYLLLPILATLSLPLIAKLLITISAIPRTIRNLQILKWIKYLRHYIYAWRIDLLCNTWLLAWFQMVIQAIFGTKFGIIAMRTLKHKHLADYLRIVIYHKGY